MSDQPGSSHLQMLFESSLQDYEQQTGIALAKHPLVELLKECNSIESIIDVLREQTQTFSESREKEKVMKPLKRIVSLLYKLSAAANCGQDIGLVRPSLD
jgi:hypothetical protein